MSHIGERIRARRQAAGLSQTALGRLCGVSGSMVVHWENGRSLPPLPRAQQIADALLMDVADLVERPRPEDEARLLKIYRALSPLKREKIIQLLEATSEVQRVVGH